MRENLPRRARRRPGFEFGEPFWRAAKDFPSAIRQGRNGVAKQFAGRVRTSCRHFHLRNAKRVCDAGRWGVKDASKGPTFQETFRGVVASIEEGDLLTIYRASVSLVQVIKRRAGMGESKGEVLAGTL